MTRSAINGYKWAQPCNKAGQQLVAPSLLLHKGLAVVLGKAISEFAQTGSEVTSTGKVNKLQSLMMACASNNNNWHKDPCNKIGLMFFAILFSCKRDQRLYWHKPFQNLYKKHISGRVHGTGNWLQSVVMTRSAIKKQQNLEGPCNKIRQQLVLPSPFDANGIDGAIGQSPFKIWTNRISRHVNWNGESFPKSGDDCFGHQ